MKTIMTVTGIRPDFIRMSEIFKQLDRNFEHILVHSGQHFDTLLSDIFFQELDIRPPDYNLCIGGPGKEHFHQSADLSVKLIELIRREKLNPDLIMFLGDSNSVTVAVPLRKEGFRIGHIEAGMRSYDKRMLEETNRVVCDHCSDLLFVYHQDYAEQLRREAIVDGVHVVGNTIVEVCNAYKPSGAPAKNKIILDIHRPENFKYPERLRLILEYANLCSKKYNLPVEMLSFKRTLKCLEEYKLDIGNIRIVDLLSYKQYLQAQFDAAFLISDSGTAQEEPALLGTPVIVPRDFTERPQSVAYGCSFMINANARDESWSNSWDFLSNPALDASWLGDGTTSKQIIDILKMS